MPVPVEFTEELKQYISKAKSRGTQTTYSNYKFVQRRISVDARGIRYIRFRVFLEKDLIANVVALAGKQNVSVSDLPEEFVVVQEISKNFKTLSEAEEYLFKTFAIVGIKPNDLLRNAAMESEESDEEEYTVSEVKKHLFRPELVFQVQWSNGSITEEPLESLYEFQNVELNDSTANEALEVYLKSIGWTSVDAFGLAVYSSKNLNATVLQQLLQAQYMWKLTNPTGPPFHEAYRKLFWPRIKVVNHRFSKTESDVYQMLFTIQWPSGAQTEVPLRYLITSQSFITGETAQSQSLEKYLLSREYPEPMKLRQILDSHNVSSDSQLRNQTSAQQVLRFESEPSSVEEVVEAIQSLEDLENLLVEPEEVSSTLEGATETFEIMSPSETILPLKRKSSDVIVIGDDEIIVLDENDEIPAPQVIAVAPLAEYANEAALAMPTEAEEAITTQTEVAQDVEAEMSTEATIVQAEVATETAEVATETAEVATETAEVAAEAEEAIAKDVRTSQWVRIEPSDDQESEAERLALSELVSSDLEDPFAKVKAKDIPVQLPALSKLVKVQSVSGFVSSPNYRIILGRESNIQSIFAKYDKKVDPSKIQSLPISVKRYLASIASNLSKQTVAERLALQYVLDALKDPHAALVKNLRVRQLLGGCTNILETRMNALPHMVKTYDGVSLQIVEVYCQAKFLSFFNNKQKEIYTAINDLSDKTDAIGKKEKERYSLALSILASEDRHLRYGFGLEVDPSSVVPEFSKDVVNQIQEYKKYIVIKDSTLPNAGKGAFWEGPYDIPKGTTIGLQTSRIITFPEAIDEKLNSAYFLTINQYQILVDAILIGDNNSDWTRYPNDGSQGRTAETDLSNLFLEKYGNFITSKDIHKGDELLWYYGPEQWKNL